MKTKDKIRGILFFVLSAAGVIFFGYNAASNVSLLFNPEEFEARITDVSFSNTHRSIVDTYRIRLEYEEDGEIKKNSAGFFFPKHKSLGNQFASGKTVTVCKNRLGFYQIKNFVKSEIIVHSVCTLLAMAVMSIPVSLLFFPVRKRPVNSLYIMANDYKIRKVKNAESASFYINQLKKHEIICFGITDRNGFAEYSYEQDEFIERTASKENEAEETIDEFSIEFVVREKMKVLDKAGK